MGDRELNDLLAMGELADADPEALQEPEAEPTAEGTPQEPAEPAEQPDTTVGGLSDVPEEGEAEPMSVDDILSEAGVLPPAEDGVDEQQAPAPEPDTPTEEPVAESAEDQRMREQAEEIQRLRRDNERLMDHALRGGQEQSPEQPSQEPQQPVDEDVLDYFRTYLGALGIDPGQVQGMMQETAPLRQRAQRETLVDFVGQHVEGFNDADLSKVEEAHRALPPDQQELFSGPMGLLALAQKLNKSVEAAPETVAPITNRMVSEASGDTDPDQFRSLSPQDQAQRVMSLTDDQILEILDRTKE